MLGCMGDEKPELNEAGMLPLGVLSQWPEGDLSVRRDCGPKPGESWALPMGMLCMLLVLGVIGCLVLEAFLCICWDIRALALALRKFGSFPSAMSAAASGDCE
jgi:hypothetical protein